MIPTTEERIAFWERVYKGYKEQRRQRMQEIEPSPYALNHPLSEDLLRDALLDNSAPVYMTIKEEEDADMALVETWDARRRAQIYLLLFDGYGMRESKAREILRKVK